MATFARANRRIVDLKIIFRALSVFVRHVKHLIPAAYAVVKPSNPHRVRVEAYGLRSLRIHKEGLCRSPERTLKWLMI